MLATSAQHILDRLHELEDQPVLDKNRTCNVIAGVIDLIEQYSQELASSLANHAATDTDAENEIESAVARRLNLSELMRELGHLILDDPLLLEKIGLIRVAFASFVDRAAAARAARERHTFI